MIRVKSQNHTMLEKDKGISLLGVLLTALAQLICCGLCIKC